MRRTELRSVGLAAGNGSSSWPSQLQQILTRRHCRLSTLQHTIFIPDRVVMVSPEPTEMVVNTSRDGLPEEEQGRRQHENAFGDRERCIWTLCAATSMITSKYLLVDLNFHYPLHLVILQLGAAGAITLYDNVTKRPRNMAAVARIPKSRPWLFNMAVSSLEALCLPLSTQAILHFPNLSTLAMLPVNPLDNRFLFTTNFMLRFWRHWLI